jgi:hypothetical protein
MLRNRAVLARLRKHSRVIASSTVSTSSIPNIPQIPIASLRFRDYFVERALERDRG